MVAAEQTRVVTTYCATCHNERGKAGGLSLASFDAMKAHEQPEVIEKMIRKLRAGMMPPPGAKRPDAAQIDQLAAALEARMDEFAASNPNPGWRPFQRLTRAEYSQAVKDLLDLDVDVTPVPAGRHPGPRLRQHRRSAGLQPGAARRLPARGLAGEPPGASATSRRRRPRPPTACCRSSRRCATSRARRSARAAASPWSTTSPPTATTSSRPAAAHDQRRAVRQHRHRHGRQQRAARDLDQRRARRGARGRSRA